MSGYADLQALNKGAGLTPAELAAYRQGIANMKKATTIPPSKR